MESATECWNSWENNSGGKSYRRRGFLRWLTGDDRALMVALRRENASEANER
jgi:hypothetical protein